MSGYVYAIKAPDGQIKVGVSANPRQRLSAVKMQRGKGCEIIHLTNELAYPSGVEREAHRLLANRQIGGGEWFAAEAQDVVAAITAAVEMGDLVPFGTLRGRGRKHPKEGSKLERKELMLREGQTAELASIAAEMRKRTGRNASISELVREAIDYWIETKKIST